jgi:hypothetical protein
MKPHNTDHDVLLKIFLATPCGEIPTYFPLKIRIYLGRFTSKFYIEGNMEDQEQEHNTASSL